MSGEEPERPLAAYAAISSVFLLVFGPPLVLTARRGRLPEAPRATELTLLAVATFRLSRLLTKDAVTGYLRAPFVRFEGMEGVTTPSESPRGHGLRRALGQLLLCPKCTGVWVASALLGSFLVAPRATRLAASALAVSTVSDILQEAMAAPE